MNVGGNDGCLRGGNNGGGCGDVVGGDGNDGCLLGGIQDNECGDEIRQCQWHYAIGIVGRLWRETGGGPVGSGKWQWQ